MRVLLRDGNDGSPLVVDAIEVNWDPTDGELVIRLANEDEYYISNISGDEAEEITAALFREGRADLTRYKTFPWDGPSDDAEGEGEITHD